MPDRIERDIEEVLARIDDFEWHRRRRTPSRARRAWDRVWGLTAVRVGHRLAALTAGHVMVLGFVILIAGVVLRGRGPGLWVLLAGILVFVAGLAWNMRSARRPPAPAARGHFWRDRYITYDASSARGLRGWLRRRRR